MADADLARLSRHSRWLRDALTVAMVLLAAMILMVWLSPLWLFGRPDHPPRSELPQAVLGGFVWWGPALFYYWALWGVRRTLADVAAGRMFQPGLARGLRDVGVGLAGGAIMSALVQPNVMRLLNETGASYPWAGYLHFDVAYLAVGTVGLALVLLSRIVRSAADMKAELDQFI